MPLTDSERNTIAGAEAARLTYASLHTGNPGSTGATEASGGSPAYARQALAFGAASGGTATASQVTFNVPAATYGYFGVWTALTGGTFLGGNPLATPQVVSSQGQIMLTVSVPVTAS